MVSYIPTLSFATAATSIFHLSDKLPPHLVSSIAQISTALGLYVIGQTAKDAARFEMAPVQRQHLDQEEEPYGQSHMSSGTSHEHQAGGMFETSESSFSWENIKARREKFFRSIPTSDVKWTVVTAGVLGGIGLFFDKETRWNCMKSAALISLAQFALAKAAPQYPPMGFPRVFD